MVTKASLELNAITKIKRLKLRRVVIVLFIIAFMSQISYAKTYSAHTLEEYKQFLEQGISNYEDVIKINYSGTETFNKDEINDAFKKIYDEANENVEAFNSQNIITIGQSLQMWAVGGSEQYHLKYGRYQMGYKNSAAELEQVDSIISDALNQIAINSKSNYEKIKATYEYVLDKFHYQKLAASDEDWDNLIAERNLLKGLNGTNGVVCDAYVMLLSKMLTKQGYENTIVSGTATGNELHVWNKVKLDGVWYNIDPTWGDAEKFGNKEKYFLTSDTVLLLNEHNWDISKYPVSPTTYIVSSGC